MYKMETLLVFFFAGLFAVTAKNPYDPVVALFKDGAIPSDAALYEAFNEFDEILQKGFDAVILDLPDVNKEFVNKHDHLIELQLTDGKLSNVETLHRVDNSTLTIDENFVHHSIRYGFKILKVNYNFKAISKREVQIGKLVSEDTGFICYADILINRETLKISLYEFRAEINNPAIKLEGNINNWQTSRLLRDSLPVMKESVQEVTAATVEQLIVIVVDDFNLNSNL